MNILIENIINYLPYIVLFVGIVGYLVIQYQKNGEVTVEDLRKIVEIGVKNAEYQYIKSGGKIDRSKLCLEIIAGLFGKEVGSLSIAVLDDIETIKLAILNDLPKTSERL